MIDDRRGKWNNAVFCIAVTALLLAPHLFTGSPNYRYPVFGPARVLSDDEPHYLIIINSLLNDGDLDLANNYAAVHAGGEEAGTVWAGLRRLDHHTVLAIDGRRVNWTDYYPFISTQWEVDADGVVQPIPISPELIPPQGSPEYSIHQYGIAFLLAPVLWPLRETTWLEPAALFCSGLAVVGAMLLYRMLLRCCTTDDFIINAVTAITFLASPVWFYGRSLFLEGWLTFFVVGAYALALRKQWSFLPGLFVALTIQFKPHEALIALPLFADLLLRREWRRAAWMALPIAASVGLLMVIYTKLYGSPLTPPQPFTFGNPLVGAAGLLFSSQWGLFLFCPVVLVALLCWPAFAHKQGRPAVLMACGVVPFSLLMMCYVGWHGSYGPRHLVPTLPLLMTSLTALPEMKLYRRAAIKALTWGLVAVGVLVNGFGVFCYSQCWSENPYAQMWRLFWLM